MWHVEWYMSDLEELGSSKDGNAGDEDGRDTVHGDTLDLVSMVAISAWEIQHTAAGTSLGSGTVPLPVGAAMMEVSVSGAPEAEGTG